MEASAHTNRRVFLKTVSAVISAYSGLTVGTWFSLNRYLSIPIPAGECQTTVRTRQALGRDSPCQ